MYHLINGGISKLGNMFHTGATAGLDAKGGTCGNLSCKGCYAQQGNFVFPNVKAYLATMADGFRNHLDDVFKDFDAQLNTVKNAIIRINHAGDFVSFEHFLKWVDLATVHSDCTFYFYTKKYHFIREYYSLGVELPANMFMCVSIWGGLGVKEWHEFKTHRNVNAFVVDLDTNYVCKDWLRCPSYKLENGKVVRDKEHNCADCKMCFTGSRKVIHVFKHK